MAREPRLSSRDGRTILSQLSAARLSELTAAYEALTREELSDPFTVEDRRGKTR
jgi:hypothetical protein